jgi:hypothetical protein
MSWTYEQISGRLYKDDGELIGKGYSGHPPHRNDPSAEGIADVGPIPTGCWYVMLLELETEKHGPYVLVLEPDDATRTKVLFYHRDPTSFLMHGDSIENPGEASDGCIVQARSSREAVWQSLDHIINVVDRIPADNGQVT